MRRDWASVLSFGVDHPLAATAAALVVTAVLAAFIPSVAIDTSADGFMVERDPARVLYDRFRQQFGTDSITLVVIKADDVFNRDVLAIVQRLSDQLQQLDGVMRVESLATARRVRVRDDDIETRLLLPAELPSAAAELADIRQYALGHRVLSGNMVAPDGRATALIVYTDPARGDTDFNRRFVERVDALLAEEERPGLTLYEVGRPLLKRTYSQYIIRDIVRLTPISAAVLMVVLLVLFRALEAVVVPMVTVGVSIVWAVGMLGLFGIPLNVVTAVIPTVLVTIGFAEDIHIIADYRARLKSRADGQIDKKVALKSAILQTAAPLLITTFTTIIGFASLSFSDVGMLQQFGYGTALALAGNYVATMLLLPPITLALSAPSTAGAGVDRRFAEPQLQRFLEWLGWFNVRHRVAILAVSGVLTLLGIVGLARIDVNTDFISYFPSDSPLRQRARDVHTALSGAEMFWIVVDTHRQDGATEPEQLERIAALQRDLAATGLVDKTVSVADYVTTINRELNGGAPADERVPASREAIAQYLLLVPGRDLSPLLTADSSAAAILVRHNVSGSARMADLERRIDGFVAARFPSDVAVNYTGESILTNNAADYMAVNELTSFAFTFIAIAIIHSALFMSVRIGLLSLIPDLIPIALVYGLMSLLGVPLDTGTAIIATVAIGIGVDDTVHHLMTYAHELDRYSNPSLAMFATLRHVARPIASTSLALALGFLVMLASSFVPLLQFGLFGALTMMLALVTELSVTPTLMMTIRVVTVWDLVLLRIDPQRLKESPCFRGFSQWEIRKVVLLGMLRDYAAGARLANHGEPGKLILVVSGRLVTAAGPDSDSASAWHIDPGDVAGEPGDASGLSADLVAELPSQVLMLDFDSLERLRRRFPFTAAKLFRNVATLLSLRLSRSAQTGRTPVQPASRIVL